MPGRSLYWLFKVTFNLFVNNKRQSDMNNSEAILAPDLLQLIIYFGAIVFVTAVMLGGAYLLGQRHRAKAADEPSNRVLSRLEMYIFAFLFSSICWRSFL